MKAIFVSFRPEKSTTIKIFLWHSSYLELFPSPKCHIWSFSVNILHDKVSFMHRCRSKYRTRAIISRGLYIFYPISKDHFFVFKEVFSENSVLMYGLYSRAACNQERLMMARVRYLTTGNAGHEIKIDFVYFTSAIPRSCMELDLAEEIIIFACSLGWKFTLNASSIYNGVRSFLK